MRNFIKKSISVFLTFLLIFSILPNSFAAIGYNKQNISASVGTKIIDLNYYHASKGYYPYKKRLDKNGNLQCVGFAYARLEEKLGLSPDFSSGAGAKDIPWNAPNGATRTSSFGQKYRIDVYKYDNGSHLTANSWACFGSGSSYYGHVIYVEEVIGNTVYYTESGTRMWKNGSAGKLKSKSKSDFVYKCDSGGSYVGTIVFTPIGTTNNNTSTSSSSSSSKNTSSSKATTSTQSTAKKPSIDVTSYPTSINQGSSYGLRGTIYANGAKTTVTTEVINKSGKAVLSTADTISANSTGNIKNMNANNKITFNTLGAGTYTLKFTAKNSAGTKTWSKEFTVKGKSSSSSSSSSSKNTSSSKATTSTQSTAKKPSIDVTSYPTSINQGSSYGLRGTIYANGAKTTVTTEVINKSGKAVLSTADTISANSTGNIKNMNANNKITFNTLGAGTYTLKFTAKNSAGTKTWSKEFTVKGKSSSSSSSSSSSKPKSTLNVNLTKYPTSINKGKSFGLRGSVTSNYKITTVIGTIHDSKGNVVQRTTDYPNSTSMDIRYANVNNNLIFNKLAKGYYVLQVTAIDASGTQKVWSSGFNVV